MGPNANNELRKKMYLNFDRGPDRLTAIAYAILLTMITFGSTLDLFVNPLGSTAAYASFIA